MELPLIDVELLVSSGAPRSAFTLMSEVDLLYRVSVEHLRQAGWTICERGSFEPPARQGPRPTHPFDLGPHWEGIVTWRAAFATADGAIVRCVVCHERRLPEGTKGKAEISEDLSPWIWIVDSSIGGRSASPVAAAADAEAAAMSLGAVIPTDWPA